VTIRTIARAQCCRQAFFRLIHWPLQSLAWHIELGGVHPDDTGPLWSVQRYGQIHEFGPKASTAHCTSCCCWPWDVSAAPRVCATSHRVISMVMCVSITAAKPCCQRDLSHANGYACVASRLLSQRCYRLALLCCSQSPQRGFERCLVARPRARIVEKCASAARATAPWCRPTLHHFVIVFDREDAHHSLISRLWQHRIGAMTYRKNVKDKWPLEEFSPHVVDLIGGERTTLMLARREATLTALKQSMSLRSDAWPAQGHFILCFWPAVILNLTITPTHSPCAFTVWLPGAWQSDLGFARRADLNGVQASSTAAKMIFTLVWELVNKSMKE